MNKRQQVSAKLTTELVSRLGKRTELLPGGFYDTFAYTQGQNLTHPVTVGLLAAVVAELPSVAIATVDHRLNNRNGAMFKPDILAVSSELTPVLAIDRIKLHRKAFAKDRCVAVATFS